MTQVKPTISNRNGKLGQFIYHFSISVKSCVYKTEQCNIYCYAKKGKMAFHQNSTYMRNYEATKLDSFVDDMIKLITPISFDLTYFRIHTSGDFYSQAYFDKWSLIASHFKDMKFLAFTRNPKIDVSRRPFNFNVIFSIDDSTEEFNDTIFQIARVIDPKDPRETDIKHMGFALDGYYCDSKCTTCRYCWDDSQGRNINFVLRGIKMETLIELTMA